MKYVTKIIPVVCILVATIISIIFLDFSQSKEYLNLSGYQRDSIRINYSDDIIINDKTMQKVLDLAKKNDVILAKSNISSNESSVKNVYVSLDSIKQIEKNINKKFNVVSLNNKITDSSYISTYDHKSKEQSFLIKDFLENDKYNYYTFSNLIKDDGNFYGEYLVFYKNYDSFVNFSNQIKQFVGDDIATSLSISDLQSETIILLVFSVIVIMVFYFIFEVYDTYYNSKKIGCMKLLGFDKIKISKIMIKNKLKVYIICSIIILILSVIFAHNMNILQFLFLLFIICILLLITYLLNMLCINIILKGYRTSNIIKKQNIAVRISKTSANLKLLMTIMMIIGISLLANSIISLNSSLKVYNNSKELLDYGIIKDFNADSPEIFDYSKQANLYDILYKDNRLSMFYSQFANYVKVEKDEAERIKTWEKEGSYFDYASVDRNYLKKEKVKIYDLDGNEVDVNDIDGVFFLFAKSEKNIIPKFKDFYLKDAEEDFHKYNIPLQFQAYLYDDQSFNSYRLDLDVKYVKNPRLRVVDNSIKLSYIESSRGISVFGNSLTTGLKFKVDDNTLDYILEDIDKAGLSNLIGESNFMSFGDYFNDEIQRARTIMMVVILGVVLVIMVYFIISIEVFSLYVKSEQQSVVVKYLLGFDKMKIFKSIINKNFLYTIIAFIISLFVLLLLNVFNVVLFILSISVFLVIDCLISMIIIHRYKFNKVYIDLKGGAND